MSNYDHNRNRPEKVTARNLAVEFRGQTYKVAVFLTTPLATDLIQAIKTKTINKQTKVIVAHFDSSLSVAKNQRNCDKIRTKLTMLGIRKSLVVCGFLEDDATLNSIQEFIGKSKIDYAFIDLCGQIKAKVASMLHSIQPMMTTSARIAITVESNCRCRDSIEAYQTAFGGQLPNAALSVMQCENATEWMSTVFAGYLDIAPTFTKHEKNLMARRNVVSNFLWQYAAITAAMNERYLNLTDATMYRDSTNMGFVQFTLGKRAIDSEERFAPIQPLLESLRKPVTNRSAAARKAWETRRANAA